MNDQKAKVLVVDDDRFFRMVLVTILEESGYDVIATGDGRQALAAYLADNDAIDLIVSDMNMPEMNGSELIEKIRETGSKVPIIILTATNEIAGTVSTRHPGADHSLQKDEHIQDTLIAAAKQALGE